MQEFPCALSPDPDWFSRTRRTGRKVRNYKSGLMRRAYAHTAGCQRNSGLSLINIGGSDVCKGFKYSSTDILAAQITSFEITPGSRATQKFAFPKIEVVNRRTHK